ncbi:MAG: lipid II:glycine glycyltransferase FemX [Clostridia bacterium]
MKSIRIDEARRGEFDDFIAKSGRPHFLQSYEWGEVKRSTGWIPHRLMTLDGKEPVGAISVLQREIPHIGSILYAPRGPIVDFSRVDALDAVLSSVREVAEDTGAFLFKVDPDVPIEDETVEKELLGRGFKPVGRGMGFENIQPRFCMRLPLDVDEETLLMNCHSKTRYNIRYAYRKGVRVRLASDEGDLRTFYDLLEKTADRQDFVIRDYDYYEALYQHMIDGDLGRLFLAEFDDRIVSGTIAMKLGDVVWYLYGASSTKHRRYMPNYAIQWEMIRWALSEGCHVYDFRGVSGNVDDPEDSLYGLYRFKKGFAARLVEYIGEFDLVYDLKRNLAFGAAMKARKLINSLRR